MKRSQFRSIGVVLCCALGAVACGDDFNDVPAGAGGSDAAAAGSGGTGGDSDASVDAPGGSGGAAGIGGMAGDAGVAGMAGDGGAAGLGGAGGTAGTGGTAGAGGTAGTGGTSGTGGAAGAAGAGCPAGYDDCDNDASNGCETALDTVANCSGCGDACPTPAHGEAACVNHACGLNCTSPFDDCDNDAANGCETSIDTVSNCGACGTSCPSVANGTPVCTNSACGQDCYNGFDDCDNDAVNGCETGLNTVTNCGACSNACPTGPHGSALCDVGSCVFGCDGGWGNCDNDIGNGCEVDTSTSASHCGSCGNACPDRPFSSPVCQVSTCGIQCDTGRANCDNADANGCEVDTNSDILNCGGCFAQCGTAHGSATCVSGQCAIQCNAGFADCDGDNSNGCETDLSTKYDCGACGHDCLGGNCTNGQCAAWVLATDPERPMRIAVDDDYVYWISKVAARRIAKSGGSASTIATGADMGPGLTVDATRAYWTVFLLTGGVQSAPLGGGSVVTLASNQELPRALAVDATRVYWTYSGGVRRKGLTGLAFVEDIVTTPIGTDAIALDATHVYYLTDDAAVGAVAKVPKAGGTPTVLASNQNRPLELALDDAFVYFTRGGTGDIVRVGKSGASLGTISSGYSFPVGIDVDNAHIFFTDPNTHEVRQMPKTGGASIVRHNTGTYPYAIKISNGIVYWNDATTFQIFAMVK